MEAIYEYVREINGTVKVEAHKPQLMDQVSDGIRVCVNDAVLSICET